MKITNVQVRKGRADSKFKGFAKVTLDDALVIDNISIIQGNDGLFVGMPSQKGKDGKFYNMVYAVDKNLRQEINKVVLEKYEEQD